MDDIRFELLRKLDDCFLGGPILLYLSEKTVERILDLLAETYAQGQSQALEGLIGGNR